MHGNEHAKHNIRASLLEGNRTSKSESERNTDPRYLNHPTCCSTKLPSVQYKLIHRHHLQLILQLLLLWLHWSPNLLVGVGRKCDRLWLIIAKRVLPN